MNTASFVSSRFYISMFVIALIFVFGTHSLSVSAGEYTPVCGSADGGSFASAPTNNLCANGVLKEGPTRSGSTWRWVCTEETHTVISPAPPIENVDCSATWIPTPPVCGSAQNKWSVGAPTSNLCSVGTPSTPTSVSSSGKLSWTWNCSNDGQATDCRSWIQPLCGSSHGKIFSTKPTSGLCATGNETPVTENSSNGWSWDCINTQDLTHGVHCNASRPPKVNPVCGNKTVEAGETCDDGNTTNGDGCSSTCQNETSVPTEDKPEDDDKKCDSSIGDTVWNDVNKNGTQDNGENGLSGITVKLLHGGQTDKDKTDANGKYSFKDLCDGTYHVVVDANDIRQGCYPTFDKDRDLDHSTSVNVNSDEKFKDADFGYYCPTAPRTGTGAIAVAVAATLAGFAVILGRKFLKLKTRA